VPALINKRVDIVPLAAIEQSVVEQSYPGRTRTLFTYNDVMMDGTGRPDNNSIVLVMSDSFIAKHRATAVKFLRAYLGEIHTMNADKKKAVTDWANAINNDKLRHLSEPPTLPDDGKVYVKSLQFDADQALRFGYLKAKVDVGSLIDNSLIDEAARAPK
jgi:ABC-type nitrate/sulfonate/bicarbonate transport system substrate-binding protein